ncbi:hypothetical protein JI735_34260 (plasmid) [Paenibacillus sonchi]|uniref:Uncharacterized protein n=1 Tax=Paenibacillus sonchi TaxID=373687 RepID=A0A974PIV4_9BACL|nr:hypothetical protein [Paenibacillus sonchi]QQZ64505.1 hypothetical protein JI735_34260 [Paenibacillus sonchi]
MEEFYREQSEKALKEIERLKTMYLHQMQEISDLKNENRFLKDQIAGKPMTEREQLLLQVANQIIKELGK